MSHVTFALENRAGVPVLVFTDGSCRPATTSEAELWAEVESYRAILDREQAESDAAVRDLRAEVERLRAALLDVRGALMDVHRDMRVAAAIVAREGCCMFCDTIDSGGVRIHAADCQFTTSDAVARRALEGKP